MHARIIRLPVLTRSCAWIERVWEQNNYLPSPITWFHADLGAASWLITRLGSGCESPRCENRASLVVVIFSFDMPFTNTASCRYWIIYFAEKRFCFLNSAVTKNGTLTKPKPTCQVRRLSKLKPLRLICMFSDKAYSLICINCLCYVHICTFLPLLSLPSSKPISPAEIHKSVFGGIYNVLLLIMLHHGVRVQKPPGDKLSPLGKFFYSQFCISSGSWITIFEFDQRKPISTNICYHFYGVGIAGT